MYKQILNLNSTNYLHNILHNKDYTEIFSREEQAYLKA